MAAECKFSPIFYNMHRQCFSTWRAQRTAWTLWFSRYHHLYHELTSHSQRQDNSKLEIPQPNPHRHPKPGHRILGPRRHHRQHHPRPRPRQRLPTTTIIVSRGPQIPPLQHRQPAPRLLVRPRPRRNPLFPRRQRRRSQNPRTTHHPRPLHGLALRPPRLRGAGHRGRGPEPGHQAARVLRRDERGRGGGGGDAGDGGDGEEQCEHAGVGAGGGGVDGDLVGAVGVLGWCRVN